MDIKKSNSWLPPHTNRLYFYDSMIFIDKRITGPLVRIKSGDTWISYDWSFESNQRNASSEQVANLKWK